MINSSKIITEMAFNQKLLRHPSRLGWTLEYTEQIVMNKHTRDKYIPFILKIPLFVILVQSKEHGQTYDLSGGAAITLFDLLWYFFSARTQKFVYLISLSHHSSLMLTSIISMFILSHSMPIGNIFPRQVPRCTLCCSTVYNMEGAVILWNLSVESFV